MRIEFNTLDLDVRVPLRFLFMSPFGGGKTWLTGYVAKRLMELTGKGMKGFDFDLGWQTLKSAGIPVDLISYVLEPGSHGVAWDEFEVDFHNYLRDPGKYGGFFIDSLTTLQGCAMDYVFRENKISRRSVGKFQLTNENDFGALVTMLMQVLPQILKISSHSVFVMTAHTRFIEDKVQGGTKMRPAVSGQALPSQIGGWFNEVWYLKAEGYRDDVVRLAQTMSDSTVDCKTQIAGMPFELSSIVAVEAALIAYGINKEPTTETLEMLKLAKVKNPLLVSMKS
jgi:hypothetical protein